MNSMCIFVSFGLKPDGTRKDPKKTLRLEKNLLPGEFALGPLRASILASESNVSYCYDVGIIPFLEGFWAT